MTAALFACSGRASPAVDRPAPPAPLPPAPALPPAQPANAPQPVSVSVTSEPLGAEVVDEKNRVLGRTPLMFVEPVLPGAASAELRYRVRFTDGRVVAVGGRAQDGALDLFASRDGRTTATPTGTEAPPAASIQSGPPGSLVGEYRCTFQQGGYRYPAFDCRIRDDGGTLRFEKDQGSQRIRATITETPEGFRLVGTFYCPWGACTDSVSASFRRDGRGGFVGTIRPSGHAIRVTIARAGAAAATPTARPASRTGRTRSIDLVDPFF